MQKFIKLSTTTILVIMFSDVTCTVFAGEPELHHHTANHDQEQGGHWDAALKLNHGKPWATDTALRQGMSRIRDAVQSATPAFKKGKLSRARAKVLAKSIETNVNFMLTNCKLEPMADASLHVILVQLLSAANEIKSDPQTKNGMPRMHEVLGKYPLYFDQPGWKAVEPEVH